MDYETSGCSLSVQALGLGPRSGTFDSCHPDEDENEQVVKARLDLVSSTTGKPVLV